MTKRPKLSTVAFRAFQAGVVTMVVLTGAGLLGAGPFAWMHHSSSSESSAPGSTPTATGPTSSTIAALVLRDYTKGQCVTWDQRPSPDTRPTKVVPCTKPHLVEIAGKVRLSDRLERYPTEPEWDRVFDHDCLPQVQALLRAPLDPYGRFAPGGIRPLADSWRSGDRTVWCGAVLSHEASRRTNTFVPFTGAVEGTAQTKLDPIGTCLDASGAAVPCTKAHVSEIVGYVDITTPPPGLHDNNAWNALVGDRCTTTARNYVGHDVSAGWIPIAAASYAAG
jgi:Septum formation